jgi:hypothetical protein
MRGEPPLQSPACSDRLNLKTSSDPFCISFIGLRVMSEELLSGVQSYTKNPTPQNRYIKISCHQQSKDTRNKETKETFSIARHYQYA